MSTEGGMVVRKVTPQDFYFRIDRDGLVTEYHGELPHHEITGRQFSDVLIPPLTEQLLREISQASQSKAVRVFEYTQRIEGVDYVFEAIITPLQGDEFLVLVRNVTEARKLSLALRS